MESVHKNQGTDDASETATIHGTPSTPHDVDGDPGDEVDIPSSLSNRAPSTQRVINEIKTMNDVVMLIAHSPIFNESNQEILFQISFWNEINKKLIEALSACAVTIEKGAKKAALSYAEKRAIIDTHAAGMLHHHALASLDMSTSEVRRHVSLLLQIIATEYTEAFGKLITYQGKGRGQSIGEQAGDAFTHACESDTFSVFPKRKVRSNVYENTPSAWQRAAEGSSVCPTSLLNDSPSATKGARRR